MPNCDWGKPCDCLDCRTKRFPVVCTHCGFENILRVVGSSEYKMGRKGLGDYEFTHPGGTKDLSCYHCSTVIPGVRYYDDYDEEGCKSSLELYKNKLNGLICSACNAIEGDLKGISFVKLKKLHNKLYCQNCIVEVGKNQIPDPSNENEKYNFNGNTLKWELDKVRIECPSCHRKRWLNAENRWRKQCKPCYYAKS
ncbi:hypothetical protein BK764_14645 [Bacillus thuringiensis serovar israelensis]|jgi:hypothetical protein|uniref:Uncharacterized protein n=4 Tax=Bacillales TaxID=1385 RepID=A0AB35P9G7_BACTU|nr:hypothetical protein BTF1_32616 [Bacillus thuringiensis HD-789]AJH03471.1 hypothetical protein AS86_6786 [Bacillus thuringiensis HD1002]AND28817.1 hypothetical protein ATN07_34500 [Bacillus thuringiensis serovar israelensis]EAO57301.1 hypothetical protein RBTH_07830 [Bacillus thuringiensis serovar israelensis ATCC 35646]EEM99553.1 hypothetical protein bthur0014_58140 [Bacillus thuringiensis IBL 4222]KAA8481738.1 hypothetical protein FYW98_29785 [Bacillus thuringiensis]KRD85557.1 hypothetic